MSELTGKVVKTALVEALCKRIRDTCGIYVITNDIQAKEDRSILTRASFACGTHYRSRNRRRRQIHDAKEGDPR
jgi:Ni2+-binding GTPase involved in maturation of urease and hydrogenase